MNDILYYPYINVPRTDWSLRTLLYYDTIGSIVPREFINDPRNSFDPFMLELIDAQLVRPLDPMLSLERPREFSRNFINHVEKYEEGFKKRSQAKNAIINQQKFSGLNIHGEKFEDEIFYTLQHLGLAERQEGNWFKVERSVANLLMKSLAAVLAKDQNMLPTTDQIGVSAFLTQKTEVITKRNTILKELMPFPENIDYKRLRTFKDQHQGLLNSFKNRVEIITLDNTIKQGSEHFDEVIKELIIRKDELAAKMNESRLGTIMFGSVCGLISAVQGFAATGNSLVGLLSAFPSFATAAHSALKIEKPENIFDQSGLKYLALMDRRIRKKI